MPRYGRAIEERREFVGYRTQSDLARAVKAKEADGSLPDELRSFSQQWLSNLEDDRTGEALLSARARQIRALAHMLKWSAAEFEQEVGVAIGSVPGFDAPAAPVQPADPPLWAPPQPQARELPEALAEAVAVFGSRPEFAELRQPRWQNFLHGLHHKRTPQSAGEWLAVFLDLRERFDPPEEGSGSTRH